MRRGPCGWWVARASRLCFSSRPRRDARATEESCRPTGGTANNAAVEAVEPRLLLSVYVVSPSGSDPNPGTIAAPFQTIQRAASIVTPGDIVLVHAGTYHETIRPDQSGTPGAHILFEPFGDGPVVISGADPVTGWTPVAGGAYQAPLPWDLGAGKNQVFLDGQPLNEARYPAAGPDPSHPTVAHADSIVADIEYTAGTNGSTITLKDANLTQPAGYWVGATVHINPGRAWAYQTGTVTASAPGGLTFTFTADPDTGTPTIPIDGNAYYLTGGPLTPDSPGEWARQGDATTGTLLLRTPAGDSPAGHDVEVKHRPFGFDLSGLSGIYVTGFTFLATTIQTDSSSQGLVLSNLDIEYGSQFGTIPDPWKTSDRADNSAIALMGSNIDLKDSTIAFSTGNGVAVAGSNNTVQGCIIHDVDSGGYNFAGVATSGSNASVLDNVIYNSGRDGIRISSTPVHVLNNVIHDVMLQTTDGGAIYSYNLDGTGSEIGYNQIYNTRTGGDGGAGIYLDNYDSNWLVDHNVIWNTDHAVKLNPVSTNNKIDSNILANSDEGIGSSLGRDMPGTVFSNNVFTETALVGRGATEQNDTRNATFTPPANPAPDAAQAAAHGSFTAPPGPPGPQIAAEAKQVQDDAAQLEADTAARAAALANDPVATRAAVAAAALTLKNDQAAAKSAKAADQARIRAGRGDRAALATARAQLQQDTATWRARIAADQKAIRDARSAGAAKLKADKAAWAAALAADKQKLKADKAQLEKDSKA